ncbi:S-layer homology domain-containing protein [Sporosarcina sp. FA9]|uniref:S-layer homology domain-containing protein n=1 Tax=Sporosarcina sp. FA9 TaxID=3413030 RepID=UPI003F65B88C
MAKNKLKMNKFLTGAVTATMVAAAVVPMASAATPAFSDVKLADDLAAATLAVENGFFKGNADGTFAPYTDITRGQVAKTLARYVVDQDGSASLEAYAVKHDLINKVTPFADVSVTHTDKELILASAIVKHAGVFTGSNNELAPGQAITRAQMASVIVRAFGLKDLEGDLSKVTDSDKVDDSHKANIHILSENGVTTETAFRPGESVKRVQMAKFLNRALEVVNPVVTTATKVVSVSATNLKEIVVAFDGTVDAVDKEQIATNAGTVESVELAEDGKSVLVTLAAAMTNQKVYKLTVKDVEAGDKVINVKDFEFTPLDNTLPTVASVTALGNKAIKVVVSEPIKDAKVGSFKIDGKSFFGSVSTDGKEVILKPYDNAVLSNGEHTLTVSLLEDFYNLKSLSQDFTFTVVEDKEGPTVTEVTATLEKATITFNEDLDPATVTASDVYWISGTTKHRASTFTKIAGNKYSFDFAPGNTLPGYETTLYIDSVSDYSGNVNATKEVKVTAQVDQVRPTVSSAKVSADALKVTLKFSKAVNKGVKSNYTITNSSGDVVSIRDVRQVDSKTVELDLYAALSGSNKLKVAGIQDTTTLKNTMLDYETTLAVGDTKAPDLLASGGVTASATDKTVLLTFSEKMDLATLSNPSNYLITFDGKVIALPSDVEVTPVQDGKAVLLQFPDEINDKAVSIRTTSGQAGKTLTHVQAMGLKDLAGNIQDGFTTGMKEIVSENAAYASGEFTDQNTIKLKFSQPIVSANKSDFTLSAGSNEIDTVTADGTNTVVIKTKEKLGTAVSNFTLALKTDNKLATLSGNKVTGTGTALTIVDKVAAVVDEAGLLAKKVVAGEDVITLTFSENVVGTFGNFAHDLEVYASSDLNTPLTAIEDYTTVAVAGNLNQIGILVSIADDESYVVKVKNAKFIKDAAGNLVVDSASYESVDVDNVATVTGVEDAELYNKNVKPVFEGLATLKKDSDPAAAFVSGTEISVDGIYVLAVTDSNGNTASITFEIDKTVASVLTKLPAAAAELTSNGVTTAIKLSEEVDTASKAALKAAVESVLTPAGVATATVAWNVDKVTLEITVAGVVAGTDKVVFSALTSPITVSDLAGNSVTLTLANLQN